MPREPEPETVHGRRPRVERDPLVGSTIDDRYVIEARIATGGFGAVYQARAHDGAPVALKVLHPSLTGDPNMVARFRREGATLTQLHDPHTVTTLAVGETADGTLYIAMELLTGESLHDRLCRLGALPWPAAIAIARAVCSSLAEAHALGVVHRDLKPANIHVERRDGADFVKVIDFGIVKIARGSAIDDGCELTFAGHMIGTFDYMSPEQLLGTECRDLSDVYALGIMLYEMLTGRRPFGAVATPAALMTAMLTETPVPPVLRVTMPTELSQLVMRCLEREPADRFESIVALAAALDHVVEQHETMHEAVTTIRAAWDPIETVVDGAAPPAGAADSRGHAPAVDEERTWIEPIAHAAVEPTRDPWHLPLGRTAPLDIPLRRAASGTGPASDAPRGFGLASDAPPPRTTPASFTMPGIAVDARLAGTASLTPPRGLPANALVARGSDPAMRGSDPMLPTTYPTVATSWQQHAPLPIRPTPYPPGVSGSTARPAPPATPTWNAIWIALVVACVTTLVLAIVLGAIP